MEIGLASHIPTYSGGLGVLAGDTLRSAADLGLPMVGVTLIYRKGYFRQHLDEQGNQTESPVSWTPEEFLPPWNRWLRYIWKEDRSRFGPGAMRCVVYPDIGAGLFFGYCLTGKLSLGSDPYGPPVWRR